MGWSEGYRAWWGLDPDWMEREREEGPADVSAGTGQAMQAAGTGQRPAGDTAGTRRTMQAAGGRVGKRPAADAAGTGAGDDAEGTGAEEGRPEMRLGRGLEEDYGMRTLEEMMMDWY